MAASAEVTSALVALSALSAVSASTWVWMSADGSGFRALDRRQGLLLGLVPTADGGSGREADPACGR
jgi:hypothetical protein